jgi:hypothetical protein
VLSVKRQRMIDLGTPFVISDFTGRTVILNRRLRRAAVKRPFGREGGGAAAKPTMAYAQVWPSHDGMLGIFSAGNGVAKTDLLWCLTVGPCESRLSRNECRIDATLLQLTAEFHHIRSAGPRADYTPRLFLT